MNKKHFDRHSAKTLILIRLAKAKEGKLNVTQATKQFTQYGYGWGSLVSALYALNRDRYVRIRNATVGERLNHSRWGRVAVITAKGKRELKYPYN